MSTGRTENVFFLETTMDENKKLEQMLNVLNHNTKDYELELRFGQFNHGNQFVPGISKTIYQRLLNFHNKHWPCEQTSTEYLILADNTLYDVNKKLIKSKEKIDRLDFYDWNSRLSLAKEKYVSISEKSLNKEIAKKRKVDRTSFIINNDVKLDLSMINNGEHYELELEVIKRLDLAQFKRYIFSLYQYFQNSYYPITTKIERNIADSFYDLTRIDIRKFKGVQPRTMQFEDLVYVNSYSFALTHKLDGRRGFVYIYKNAVILIDNGGHHCQITKIAVLSNERYHNSIFDVEIMDKIHLFDTIFYCGRDLRSEQNSHFYSRFCYTLEFCKENYLPIIDSKEYHFSSDRNSFHRACSILWKKYGGEGLIVFREDMPYPRERLNYFYWKWKHTITFDLLYKDGILLCGYKDKYLPFRPKNCSNLHLANHISFKPYPNNSIIECKYEFGEMVALRKREDKVKPNMMVVALDNYYYFEYPISDGLLAGEEYYPDDNRKEALPTRVMEFVTHQNDLDELDFTIDSISYIRLIPVVTNDPVVPVVPVVPVLTVAPTMPTVPNPSSVASVASVASVVVETRKNVENNDEDVVMNDPNSTNEVLMGRTLAQWKLQELKDKCKELKVSTKGSKINLFEKILSKLSSNNV